MPSSRKVLNGRLPLHTRVVPLSITGPGVTVARAVLIVVFGCAFAAAAALIGLVALLVLSPKPDFDRAHPDYAYFAERFEEARRIFASGRNHATIDLAHLNGGAWRTACLFGGYTHPIEKMDALGAVVSEADRQRLSGAVGARIAPVEEFEVLIAYIDEERRAHFIHFAEGVGSEGQHYEACTTKPETKIVITG
jgi:hypothetical protein